MSVIQGPSSASEIPLDDLDRPQNSEGETRVNVSGADCEPDYLRTREQLLQELKEDATKRHSEKERADAFTYVADVVKIHSEELIQRWNKEIDALLTYAGLFSAVLTAFNVESYQLLKPDSTDETTAILLRISAQLGSLTVASPFINSTRPSYELITTTSPGAPRYAVWLNALWFSSLICSLASASVGLMVKQWISEYSSGLSGNSREIARLRQYRFNNLQKWRVPEIVAMLPLLLQASLFLFLIGLVILLWSLNASVAAVALILIGTLLTFTLMTIILPSVRDDCCYLSPQSVAFFQLREWTKWSCRQLGLLIVTYFVRPVLAWCWDLHRLFDDPEHPIAGWIYASFNIMLWRTGDWKAARRPGLPPHRRWWERQFVVQRTNRLDVDMMTTAFTITTDPRALQLSAPLLFELSGKEVLRYHRAVRTVLESHWGKDFQSWPVSTTAPYLAYSTSLAESALIANLETTSEPYRNGNSMLLRNGQLLDQANLKALTRVAAIASMSSPDDPVGRAMRSLKAGLEHTCDSSQSTIDFPAVASAVAFGLDIFKRLHQYTSSQTADEVPCEYADTLQVALLCVAREMADPSSQDVLVARASARRALSSLQRILQLPIRERILDVWDSRDIVNVLGRFAKFSHCRDLVTTSLLDNLAEFARACGDADNADTVARGVAAVKKELRLA